MGDLSMITTQSKAFRFKLDTSTLDLWISPGFYEMTAMQESESYSFERLWDLIHPDDVDTAKHKFLKAVKSGDFASIEFRIMGRNGEYIFLRSEMESHQAANGTLSIIEGCAYDITDFVNTSSRISEMQELLAMKDQAIAMIAHDLRNPISQVDGILQMISADLAEGKVSEIKDLVSMARDSVNHTYEILKDLNEATRNKVEGKSIELSPTELKPMLQQCADAFKLKLDSKSLNLELNVDKGLKANINEVKMIRAVENLLSNAIKFSPERKRIILSAWSESDRICIAVEDAGIGMPEHIRKRLFSGITKSIRRAGTAGENSVGIGLSIVKGVIDLHHGHIKVESEEGEGSKFTICVPK